MHEKIEEDRKLIMEATLVRIMKTRKRLKHQELILEAIDQLKASLLLLLRVCRCNRCLRFLSFLGAVQAGSQTVEKAN